MRFIVVMLAVLAALASPGQADRVIKKDGTAVSGVIISENATGLVIQVSRGGAVMKYPIERSAIASVERTPVATRPATQPATQSAKPAEAAEGKDAGPGYYALPVTGEIGIDVTAATLREALGHARRVSPAVIVIVFDTEGGDLESAGQLVQVLREQPPGMRIVAHVRKALSICAIVAIALPEIYITKDGLIGASAVEEAMAKTAARLAAEQGGHPALLAESMFDPDLELMMTDVQGKPRLFVQGELPDAPAAKVIKSKGRLLTLSADDAVAYGLARGVRDSLDDLHLALGMSAPLAKLPNPGWYLIERKAREARQEMARQDFIADRQRAHDAYMEKFGPELEAIDARLEQIRPELRAAEDTLRDLDGQWSAETRAIENEYRTASRIDTRLSPDRRARLLDQARARREQKLTLARERFQPQVIQQRQRINELTREYQALAKKRKAIADGAPRVPK